MSQGSRRTTLAQSMPAVSHGLRVRGSGRDVLGIVTAADGVLRTPLRIV